ncbi:F110A protein, partial [Turnix velox]|nr:F110A protein [Turnix velox]
MPVEALHVGEAMKGVMVAAPFTSAMPGRVLRKGPAYFRRRPEPSAAKPSAVERLEADKAKYVKSQQVASTRQEPVKPPLLKQPLFTPGMRWPPLTPSLRTPRRGEPGGTKTSLDLEILNNLINLRDSPFPKADTPFPKADTPLGKGRVETPVGGGTETTEEPAHSPSNTKPPGSVAVRRVDVRPCGVPQGQVTPIPSSPIPGGTPLTPDRFSRAELERFFNYCGLEPEEVQEMGAERLGRASSDIVSLQPPSASTASSDCAHSPPSLATPDGRSPPTRVPYGISVIERNARVIKWLYGLRQARDTQRVSDV